MILITADCSSCRSGYGIAVDACSCRSKRARGSSVPGVTNRGGSLKGYLRSRLSPYFDVVLSLISYA